MTQRKHALHTAGFWFKAARIHQEKGEMNEALIAMEQAYNHVEGALIEGVRCLRGTCPVGYFNSMTGERRQKFLNDFNHVSD